MRITLEEAKKGYTELWNCLWDNGIEDRGAFLEYTVTIATSLKQLENNKTEKTQ